jgi:hypothetical protein
MIRIAMACLVCLFLLGSARAGETSYRRIDVLNQKIDLSIMSLTDCHRAFWIEKDLFTISCFDTSRDTPQDSGIRLFVLQKAADGRLKILYHSRGGQDSYILKPTVFKSPKAKHPILILAETGAEYSWGIEVFLVQGRRVTHAGYMEVGADVESESENPVSAVPYTRIKARGKKLVFTFEKNLVYMRGGKFTTLKKNQIRYEYDGKTLKEIISKTKAK